MLIFAVLFSGQHKTITNPKQYKKALNMIEIQDEIRHFPKEIPSNAKNVKMYNYTSDSNGEFFLLQFKIDKDYIEQELKKNDFINKHSPIGIPQDIYHFYSFHGIKPDGCYTLYVIDNAYNRDVYNDYFPYYSGIGISNNFDHILYYYFNLEDKIWLQRAKTKNL